ncbi:hypothetical protein ACFPIJ_61960 [Dactylosporangium cerinum]|uniref:Uncharacterized protein n=1 Tax=Dactylosporangium cerinum TaxID=1434730 RepID=A0ABV9WIQ3_9ACTN
MDGADGIFSSILGQLVAVLGALSALIFFLRRIYVQGMKWPDTLLLLFAIAATAFLIFRSVSG